ncbi:PspC domain-containing protein [Saccharibacillus sp. JS10]|uniref:PspC domain-containing protein n=1 Tax=Saccharibacillus sp. JS10 TaxID=2950552 RepID=UPI00210BD348|nr:PspC domain-containing protein [Saccharibacillus sp. JS10]MCQ4088516.1 PspC domain-containing protein [Saccharibacillus sp. JS10]
MQKLYRSTHDRMLTGLCGGLAQEYGVNPTLLRVLFLVGIPLTSGAILPIYFIASLVIQKETPPHYPYGPENYRDPYRPGHPQDLDSYGPNFDRSREFFEAGRQFQQRPETPNRPQQPRADLKKSDIPDSGLDAMMEDVEKKALKKEVEELKMKLAKYENENEKGDL